MTPNSGSPLSKRSEVEGGKGGDPEVPKKILVFGVTGSGKTTLAKRISEATGIPWHDVDSLTWLPNWQEVPHEEQRRMFAEITSGEEWILDTAYGKWRDIVTPRADLIVALDYPRWLSFGRLLKRSLTRVITKSKQCGDNVETWAKLFSRDSILLWHLKSFDSKRRQLHRWLSLGEVEVIVFRRPYQADAWVESLKKD